MFLRYRRFWILLVCVLVTSIADATAKSPYCAIDPYLDPKNDLCNPLRYIPSNRLTSIALACCGAVTVALFASMYVWGGKFMLAMPVGGVGYCIGFCFRYAFHANPQSTGTYIGEHLFIVLSPCAFIAAVYVLLGRLSQYLETGHHLLIRPQRVTLVFVTSDIITFLIQASGGGISTSPDAHTRELGEKMFLVGLILQLISFAFFVLLLISWTLKVRRLEPMKWGMDSRRGKSWYSDWRALLVALFVSCAGIMIRSFYRTIELAQGYTGTLATTEGYFYVLDVLPLLIATGVFAAFWPGRFITPDPSHTPIASEARKPESIELSSASTQYQA